MSYVFHCWVEFMMGLNMSYVLRCCEEIQQWRTYGGSKFVICSPLLEKMYGQRMYGGFEPVICSPLLGRINVRFEHVICSPLLWSTFGSGEHMMHQNLSQLKTSHTMFSAGPGTYICSVSAENILQKNLSFYVFHCWGECITSLGLSYVLHYSGYILQWRTYDR